MFWNILQSKVPELKRYLSWIHGESEGANFACDLLSNLRFAHAACHYSNSGTVSTQALCFLLLLLFNFRLQFCLWNRMEIFQLILLFFKKFFVFILKNPLKRSFWIRTVLNLFSKHSIFTRRTMNCIFFLFSVFWKCVVSFFVIYSIEIWIWKPIGRDFLVNRNYLNLFSGDFFPHGIEKLLWKHGEPKVFRKKRSKEVFRFSFSLIRSAALRIWKTWRDSCWKTERIYAPRTRNYGTPMHAAATCGHLAMVKLLIETAKAQQTHATNTAALSTSDHATDMKDMLLAINSDGNMPFDLAENPQTLTFIEHEMQLRG